MPFMHSKYEFYYLDRFQSRIEMTYDYVVRSRKFTEWWKESDEVGENE